MTKSVVSIYRRTQQDRIKRGQKPYYPVPAIPRATMSPGLRAEILTMRAKAQQHNAQVTAEDLAKRTLRTLAKNK